MRVTTWLDSANRAYERMVFFAFVDPLHLRVKRPIEQLMREGLLASDFPATRVVVVFEDRSELRYEYAFALRHDGMIGVFTEHCGYHAIREGHAIAVETDGRWWRGQEHG